MVLFSEATPFYVHFKNQQDKDTPNFLGSETDEKVLFSWI